MVMQMRSHIWQLKCLLRNAGSKTPVNNVPEAPSIPCCMTGCPNCVWLQYAEELTKHFQDGGENAKKEIEKRIFDGNMKAYLLFELRMRTPKE